MVARTLRLSAEGGGPAAQQVDGRNGESHDDPRVDGVRPAAELGSGLNAVWCCGSFCVTGIEGPLSAPFLPRPGENAVQFRKKRVFLFHLTPFMHERGYLFILEPEQRERLIP